LRGGGSGSHRDSLPATFSSLVGNLSHGTRRSTGAGRQSWELWACVGGWVITAVVPIALWAMAYSRQLFRSFYGFPHLLQPFFTMLWVYVFFRASWRMFDGRSLLFSVLVGSTTLSAMGAQSLDLPILYGGIPDWAICFLLLVAGVPSAFMALSASISAGLLGVKWREFRGGLGWGDGPLHSHELLERNRGLRGEFWGQPGKGAEGPWRCRTALSNRPIGAGRGGDTHRVDGVRPAQSAAWVSVGEACRDRSGSPRSW